MASLALRQNIIEIIELNSRGQRFVPLISLSKLLPCDEISRILRDLDIVPFYRLEEHSHIIKTHYLQVFSILCLVGGMKCLHTSFIQRNIDDSKLPLSTQDIVKLPPEIQKGFSLEQHIFLCPNLRKGLIYQIFDDWTVLPFTEENTLKGGHGAYGTVYKVKIHKDYQKLHLPHPSGTDVVAEPYFARKEIKKDQYEASTFESERQALEILMQIKHKHVIELLMAYHHANTYNLLFPLADMNLATYLERSENFPRSIHDRIQLWTQVENVMSALQSIHNITLIDESLPRHFLGYHHDLKPQNILIFNRTFVIADLGLARFKPSEMSSKTGLRHGTNTYGPPESHKRVNDDHPIISRKFDVWSLGCILAEIITFACRGPNGVMSFSTARTTADLETCSEDDWFHNMKDVKQEVLEWLKGLQALEGNDEFLSGVISLVRDMLHGNPEERPDSTTVLKTFCSLLFKLKKGSVGQEIILSPVGAGGIGGLKGSIPDDHTKQYTLLQEAAASNNLMVLDAIFRHVPNCFRLFEAKNSVGRNTIHIAALAGSEQFLETISRNGVDFTTSIQMQDKYGNSPLHLAAERGFAEIFDCLMLSINWEKARLDLTGTLLEMDNKGMTVLHRAALNGRVAVTKIILRWAEKISQLPAILIDIQDDKGRIPLEIAKTREFENLVDILSRL